MICLLYLLYTYCSIVSSSSLQSCTNDGNDLNCTSKIVVVLTLESQQLNSTESLSFNITQVTNGSDILALREPLNISFSKSEVKTQYILTYMQDYSYYAYEEIIYTAIFGCNDQFKEAKATCGIVKNTDGSLIADSQGFCCNCNISEILGATETINRGKDCGNFNMGTGSASAHCLRFNELTYSSYAIGVFQYSYIIVASIGANITVTVSPQMLSSLQSGIKVKLLGDLYPSNPPPTLSDKILLVPTSPSTHPKVKEGYTSWMLVPPDKITEDGRDCDKIGVGYASFKYQGDKCRVPTGTCLGNQIKDLYDIDMGRLKNNQSLLYMIAMYGKYDISKAADNTVYLDYSFSGRHSTMVSLELEADSVAFITNVASAAIVIVKVDTFEAMSSTGRAIVTINNTGKVVANFNIGIVNCTGKIIEISAKTISAYPGVLYDSDFVVTTTYEKAMNYTCIAYVSNSLGEITDTKEFSFATKDKITVNYQNGTNSTSNGQNITSEEKEKSCALKCAWYNIICLLLKGCTSQILKLAIYALAIIFGIKLIICLIYKKPCKRNQSVPPKHYNNNINYDSEIQTEQEIRPRKYSSPVSTSIMYYNCYHNGRLGSLLQCGTFSVKCETKTWNGDIGDVVFRNPTFERLLGIISRTINISTILDEGVAGLTNYRMYHEFDEKSYSLCLTKLACK